MNIKEIKNRYRYGMRIELISMDDKQAPPEGTQGTVLGVDDIGSILISWDTGSSLNLIPGEDRFRIVSRICSKCGRTYTEPPAISRDDNLTEICPECGMAEAIAAFKNR